MIVSLPCDQNGFVKRKEIYLNVGNAAVEGGYEGSFELVVTKVKKMAITGIKNGKRQVAWFEDPDYEDWTGRFED